ncbi:17089_t:CDS:2 [Entrophospora sp. SA101]|nr:17089_t:CDS:2 [Entrophospora sp. SA101]
MNSMKYIAFHGSYEKLALSNPANVIELKKIEALIIEEVSMVDSDLFMRPSSTPSVHPSQVFRSPVWKKNFPLFLTTPQRQINGVEFYRILQEIRTGNLSVRSKQIIQAKINQETDLCSFYDTTHVVGT